MVAWEYLTVKLYDYGSPEGEEKNPKDFWVTPDGLLALMDRLGAQGWEAVTRAGVDVIMKRPMPERSAPQHAVVAVEAEPSSVR
ncbi:MAG: hypothetical protein QOJ65_1533 [Fimbriimonadaceae bacterium]|jgi:hypothetical protein|nr:hypothetical protein [Fimbriimonadaceae bacterium]